MRKLELENQKLRVEVKNLKEKQRDLQEDLRLSRDNSRTLEKMYNDKIKYLNSTLEEVRQKNQTLIEHNMRDNDAKNQKIEELVKIIERNFGVETKSEAQGPDFHPVKDSLQATQGKDLEAKLSSFESSNEILKLENSNLKHDLENLQTSLRAYRSAIHEKDFRSESRPLQVKEQRGVNQPSMKGNEKGASTRTLQAPRRASEGTRGMPIPARASVDSQKAKDLFLQSSQNMAQKYEAGLQTKISGTIDILSSYYSNYRI